MITRIKNQDFESAGRLEVALEEYLVRRGMLDVDEWLGRYPDCTTELLEFLNNQIHIGPIAAAFSKPVAMPTCRIGDYEILEIVDRGGMGIVYKAYQRTLRRIVALKMIQQGQFCSPEVRRRFQNEAETAARLRHPNLVAIHEVGEHNGIPFFSMEFVKGRTLADLSRQSRIRPGAVAKISKSIAETIHYIHSCGVLHRDLKPSNVMIDDHCEVRVTDFGLAKQLDQHYSLTETGQILGSINYMPPEQAEARHELMGPASDVYSIGVIMYELLTGRPPFKSETFLDTLRQIREQLPVRPTELDRHRLACEDLFTLQTAHMAAVAEAIEDVSTNSLIRLGFLPEGFNQRSDHCIVESNQGEFYDSQRGVHGTFLPIADMASTRCTRSEWRAYEEFKKTYQQEWRTMDPVVLTFNRRPQTHPDRENVVLNIRITPYAQQEYRFLQQYLSSQPDDRRLAMSDDDLMAVSGQLTRSGTSYLTHIGLVDEQIPFEIRDGQIHRTGPNSKLSFARSNAFALVQPGGDEGIRVAVDFMRNVKRRQPTGENTEASRGTLSALVNWILPIEAMINSAIKEHSQSSQKATVLSMDSMIGRNALNQLKTENAPRPAQLFMQLRDVASSQVYEYLRAYTYVSSRQASADDAAALNHIAAMLQADPAEIRLSLEQSFGATIKCPAGGTYQLTDNGGGPQRWTSSAWQKTNLRDETAVPDEYQFPFLTWLRGMSPECSLTRTTLQSRLELEVARQTPNEPALLPVEIVSTSR